jgi:hypothetical protein
MAKQLCRMPYEFSVYLALSSLKWLGHKKNSGVDTTVHIGYSMVLLNERRDYTCKLKPLNGMKDVFDSVTLHQLSDQ